MRRAEVVCRAAAMVLAFLLLAALPAAAQDACDPGQADLRSGGAVFRFAVEVADSDATRARGLMFRESLPRFSGMLFVYPEPLAATFWMENTLIPLDMLFFDPAGRLTHIHENAVPLSREVIFGGENVLYVLEINGGLARTLGIAEGAEIRHPAIDPASAAWPCPEG
jgi:uncharacterized protein